MSIVKQLSFVGKTIYCGLDVHKTNWKVNVRMGNIEITAFSQNPNTLLLNQNFGSKKTKKDCSTVGYRHPLYNLKETLQQQAKKALEGF